MSENLEKEQKDLQLVYLNEPEWRAGGGGSPACCLVVGAGARLAVIRATSARVSKVSGAAFVTAGSFGVVLAALRQKEQPTGQTPEIRETLTGYLSGSLG